MGMPINKDSYKYLIDGDIEWVKKMMDEHSPNSLEGQHIIEVLKDSLKKYDDFWRYS